MKANYLIKGWKQWFTAPPEGLFKVKAILLDGSFQYLRIETISNKEEYFTFITKIEYKLYCKMEAVEITDTKGNKKIMKLNYKPPRSHSSSPYFLDRRVAKFTFRIFRKGNLIWNIPNKHSRTIYINK